MADHRSTFRRSGDDSAPRILIIDDNEHLCKTLVRLIRRMEMTAVYETSLQKGFRTATTCAFDVIFLDVNLPDGCGLDIIPRLREGTLPPEIIIITGYSDEDGAEIAIRNQAWDYLPKDASLQNLKLSLTQAILYREQKKAVSPHPALERDGIIGHSPLINACLEQVFQAAGNGSPVMILGETGTGKELFARAIHDNSRRAEGDFVVVDCGAMPGHLVESTLFGHKKGAFTDAIADRIGLIEQAHGGTLFLDEIGELPMELQKTFLRVLQEKRFRPLGSKREVESDFRLICATNRNLSEMVKSGTFRKDLLFRIRSIVIKLPPLKDRSEDIPELISYYMNRQCRLGGRSPHHKLSPDFIEALQVYSWPGNIRELFNVIDCVHAETLQEPELFPRHLPVHIRAEAAREKIKTSGAGKSKARQALPPQKPVPLKSWSEFLEEMRFQYIKKLMEQTQGTIPDACRISKLSRGHLYSLLKKYNLHV